LARPGWPGLIVVAAATLTLLSASPASADPATYDHYLDLQWVAYLSANGITVDNPDQAGKLGRTICYVADHGYNVNQIEQYISSSTCST
jgi:hypothetical protein